MLTLLVMPIVLPYIKHVTNVDAIVKTLGMSAKELFRWFKNNQTTGNTGKC